MARMYSTLCIKQKEVFKLYTVLKNLVGFSDLTPYTLIDKKPHDVWFKNLSVIFFISVFCNLLFFQVLTHAIGFYLVVHSTLRPNTREEMREIQYSETI